MTDDIIIPLLKKRLSDWSETPVKWPNEIFSITPGTPYIRVEFFNSTVKPAAINNSKQVSRGFIRVSVFTPVKTGTERIGQLSGMIVSKLTSWRDGGLQCFSGRPYPGPDQPIWLQRNIDISFKYNQCNEG